MAGIVVPGNMISGAQLALDYSTAAINEQDIVKMAQSKLDYNNPDTYVIIPAGQVMAVEFALPEKAYIEKVRVFYTPEGFATFDGVQAVKPYQCYITQAQDIMPIVLRDSDLVNTFRDPNLTTAKLVDGADTNYNADGWVTANPNYGFQTSHAWNSIIIDFGIVIPLTFYTLYTPRYVWVNFGGTGYYMSAFSLWYYNSNLHAEMYSSFDGIKFNKITDILVRNPVLPAIPGITDSVNSNNSGFPLSDARLKYTTAYLNNTDQLKPHYTRYLKMSQNGARFGYPWASSDFHASYGVSEVYFNRRYNEQQLVNAVYYRDGIAINMAHTYDGYQIPDPTNNPTLRYQDIYINDITDKIRISVAAHPSYNTWIGGVVAMGSYSGLNFGRGSDNQIPLLDAPVGVPGVAQPVVINNDSLVEMTNVQVEPNFELSSDFEDVTEISEDNDNWDPLFTKIGYPICSNDLGTSCGVGNPDKQYVFKCQQGFRGECTAFDPLSLTLTDEVLSSVRFFGNPKDGSEVDSWDGSNATYWVSALTGPDPANNAWTYDFGALKFISHIKARVLTNNHTIEVSTNGSTWELTSTVVADTDQYFKIDGNYRYIRIYTPTAVTSKIVEVDIYTVNNVYRDKTFIALSGVTRSGIINDLWYSIGYIPYNDNGDVELYVLRPNGLNYDLLYSSGIITISELGIYRHLVDRRVEVIPGDLIAIYTDRCAPQLLIGGGNTAWGDGNIIGTVPKSNYTNTGFKVGHSARIGTLLSIGNIGIGSSKVVYIRSNIPNSLSQAYEREVDLIVSTRVDL